MNSELTEHVDHASESIRAANHSAFGPLNAPDAYAVVGGLAELAHRLPQLLDYLTRSVHRADPAKHYDDRGLDPTSALRLAFGDLFDARHQVDVLADHLDSAHNHLGHLGRRTSED